MTQENRGPAHSICNLKFNMSNEIPVVFDNGSNYEFQFIVRELAKGFEGLGKIPKNINRFLVS